MLQALGGQRLRRKHVCDQQPLSARFLFPLLLSVWRQWDGGWRPFKAWRPRARLPYAQPGFQLHERHARASHVQRCKPDVKVSTLLVFSAFLGEECVGFASSDKFIVHLEGAKATPPPWCFTLCCRKELKKHRRKGTREAQEENMWTLVFVQSCTDFSSHLPKDQAGTDGNPFCSAYRPFSLYLRACNCVQKCKGEYCGKSWASSRKRI